MENAKLASELLHRSGGSLPTPMLRAISPLTALAGLGNAQTLRVVSASTRSPSRLCDDY